MENKTEKIVGQFQEKRPTWDQYFLMIAETVSLRSDDKFIKHGAVIVDNSSKHILGTGYNGTIPGADMELVRPYDREFRRNYMQHAEKNCILNCSTNPKRLPDGASIYVTGLPCTACLQDIISFGIKRIIHLERIGSVTEDTESAIMRQNLIKMSGIKVECMSLGNWSDLIKSNFEEG